jgi:hypothetical protein
VIGRERIERRQMLAGLGAVATSALLPAVARASGADPHIVALARRELERAGGKVWIRDKVGIADFSKPSSEMRFHVVDMLEGTVQPYFVTHGRGSDPEHDGWLKSFSNMPESNATSRGAYVTRNWYTGKHGLSMRLIGLDADNYNAEDRAIVIHGAWYANPDLIPQMGKLGRSEGCFAFAETKLMEIAARLGPGRLVFADRL